MHPPKATGTKAEIQEVIEANAGEDYVLDYPKSGNNRSAITMYDLDGDDILNGGYFGHYDKHHVLGHNLPRLYRDARLLRYYPAEALSEPIFRTWHFFWRMKNKK